MKILEYKNLKLFLTVLFNFLRDNKIESSVCPADDYVELLERILNAEFISFSCMPGFEDYSIDFRLNPGIKESEVYMPIFGRPGSNKNTSLLIDLGEGDMTSFISLSWYEGRMPFFVRDFIDGSGMLVCENSGGTYEELIRNEDIMDYNEFISFLHDNTEQRWISIVMVD